MDQFYFQKRIDYSKDSEPVMFDKAQLLVNQKIDYLFDQLKDVREVTGEFTSSFVAVNYNGEIWTSDKRGIIFSFFTFRICKLFI